MSENTEYWEDRLSHLEAEHEHEVERLKGHIAELEDELLTIRAKLVEPHRVLGELVELR